MPGTELHRRHVAAGTLLDEQECPPADTHGQYRFNYRHPNIPPGEETAILARAFARDFDANGPSLVRIVRTTLNGYRRYKQHPDLRVRKRFVQEARGLSTVYAGLLWATERWLGRHTAAGALAASTRRTLVAEFGARARVSGPLIGTVLLGTMRLEARRLRRGWTYEPATFYEANDAALAQPRGRGPAPARCASVLPVCVKATAENAA